MPDGRLVSFIRDNFGAPPPGTVPDPSQIERQMALAQSLQQQRANSPPVTNVLQGLNQLAQAAVSGMAGRRAQQGMEARNNAAAETFSGLVDWSAFGIDPAQGRQLAALNPEIPTMLWQMQLEQQAAARQPRDLMTVGGNIYDPNNGTWIQGPQEPAEPTDDIREFEYARQNGFEGTFAEWQMMRPPSTSINMPQMGNVPPGYRVTYDEQGRPVSMEPVPGSPAALEAQAAEDAAANARQGELNAANIVLQDIDRALGLAGAWTTGWLGARLSGIEGTPAYDLVRLVDTIRANVGFDKLQQMRDASPTGGALGQVSERENALLQSTLGNLDSSQSQGQFEENLRRLKNVYLDIVHGPGNWSVGEDGSISLGGAGEIGSTPAIDPAEEAGSEPQMGASVTLDDGTTVTYTGYGWRFPDGIVRVFNLVTGEWEIPGQ